MFLAGCVGVFALLTGLLALDRQPGEPWGGWLPPLLAGLIALGALLALAQPSRVLRSRAPWLTVALLVLMMMLPVVVSGSRHLGLRGSHLALMSLVVAFTTGMLGRRTGLVFALGGTLALLALSVVERLSGWTPSTGTGESLGVRLVIHLCMLGLGLIVGLGLHRILRKALADGHERMAQFQGLLQMAVDWYWEMDQHLRFTHIVEMTAGISGLAAASALGRTPCRSTSASLTKTSMPTAPTSNPTALFACSRGAVTRPASRVGCPSAASHALMPKATSAATGAPGAT